MELREALTQIHEIRRGMARAEMFRGYRALPAAFSGLVAVVAAAAQVLWLDDPAARTSDWLLLWIGAAAVSFGMAFTVMILHCVRSGTPLHGRTTAHALEQFLPCVLAGALVTFAMDRYAAEALWLLPGLWQTLFGLGLFACVRVLPRGIACVAFFYVLAGAASIAWAHGPNAFSPWAMAVPFGAGQLASAAILYFKLEREDGAKTAQKVPPGGTLRVRRARAGHS